MTLLTNLNNLKTHPVLKNLFNRLNKEEKKLVEEFATLGEGMSRNDYMHKANRWFMDAPVKPKRLADMWAIVTQIYPLEERKEREKPIALNKGGR